MIKNVNQGWCLLLSIEGMFLPNSRRMDPHHNWYLILTTLRELTCELRRVDPTALGSSRIRVLHLTLQESRKSSPRLQAVPLSRLLRRH
ncbi:hypothetical protein AX14_010212 [Amanita brunnescens Koide BX004]|nr:hypothetical protein AX14_010212 [Amanita brunnescens Koide BX004]